MKPIKRTARRARRSDSAPQARVPSQRPFRSDRPEGPPPIRRGPQNQDLGGARRWPSPKQPHAKPPWGEGPGGPPPHPPGKPGDRDWPPPGGGGRPGPPPPPPPRPPH